MSRIIVAQSRICGNFGQNRLFSRTAAVYLVAGGKCGCSDSFSTQRYLLTGLSPPSLFMKNDARGYAIFDPELKLFSAAEIEKSYTKDGMDRKTWMLIYSDLRASKVFKMMALGFYFVIVVVSVCVADYMMHNSHEQMDAVRRMRSEAEMVGIFAFCPIIMTTFVFCLFARMVQKRILRIYQNRTDPTRYTAIKTIPYIWTEKLSFSRSEIAEIEMPEENRNMNYLRSVLLGNTRIGNRHLYTLESGFREGIYQTYMFSVTNRPPPLDAKSETPLDVVQTK